MDRLRINTFIGGISTGERDRRIGVASNVEEIDIFTNPNWIQPVTIFGAEAGITRRIQAYDLAESDTAYAYGQAADGDAEIWALTTASADDPGTWTSVFESTNDVHPNADMKWHKWTTGEDYLYYPTVSSTTVTLRKLGDLTTYTETSVGTLTGLDATGDRMQIVRAFGELYGLNGRYIFNVADDGTFTEKAFTLPTDLIGVSMTIKGNTMYILCKFITGDSRSRIVLWDLTATSGPDDQIDIAMGGPQWIVNHNDTLRVCCALNGVAKFYEVTSFAPEKKHELYNIQTETNAQPISPIQSIFIKDNILHFGLWKTDKTGLYAIGRTTEDAPLALVLDRRFDTSDYSLHKPYAANVFGPNIYVSFDDNGTADIKRIEGNNSPTRSSNSVYESIFMDFDDPEVIKDLHSEIIVAKVLPASTEIKVDYKVDNASSYDSGSLFTLTSSNDQTHDGGTADTFWYRTLTGVAGRFIIVRVRFTSSTTSRPQLYSLAIFSNSRSVM